jgi:hypothetical protein
MDIPTGQHNYSKNPRIECVVGLQFCRKLIGRTVVTIENRPSRLFVRTPLYKSPHYQLAALEWASSWVLEPENPPADKVLAIKDRENDILDHPFAIGARCLDTLDAGRGQYEHRQ